MGAGAGAGDHIVKVICSVQYGGLTDLAYIWAVSAALSVSLSWAQPS